MTRYRIIETIELEVEANSPEEAEQIYLEASSDDEFNPQVIDRYVGEKL